MLVAYLREMTLTLSNVVRLRCSHIGSRLHGSISITLALKSYDVMFSDSSFWFLMSCMALMAAITLSFMCYVNPIVCTMMPRYLKDLTIFSLFPSHSIWSFTAVLPPFLNRML